MVLSELSRIITSYDKIYAADLRFSRTPRMRTRTIRTRTIRTRTIRTRKINEQEWMDENN